MSLGNNVKNYSSLFFFSPHPLPQNEGDFCQEPLLCSSPIIVHRHGSTRLSLPLNKNEDFSVGKSSLFRFLEHMDPSLFNRDHLSIWSRPLSLILHMKEFMDQLLSRNSLQWLPWLQPGCCGLWAETMNLS